MRKLFLLLLSFQVTTMVAQTTVKGNVVEYFGKEKIETTAEGKVLHQFTNGFFLIDPIPAGTLFNGQDIVAWNYANTATLQSKVNKEWTPVSADSAGVFKSTDASKGFLFTQFNAANEQIVLLETTGGTRTYVNGFPHEGDTYDYGYALAPIVLKKGHNEFIFTAGRYGRVATKLVIPSKNILFTSRDMTLPDVIIGETNAKWGAIRIINATTKAVKGLTITTELATGEKTVYQTDAIMPLHVRKAKFLIPATTSNVVGPIKAVVTLSDSKGKVLDTMSFELQVRKATVHHERTFLSKVDKSVQYYSLAPALNPGPQALVLSVHGASVEARNQTRAYKQKDWTHIVAPTNRRPFGYNWEEWGRIDALEVLAEAKKILQPIPALTYLTGHSMGGHGSWFLGTNYPDKFAAVAPCASYPDIMTYRSEKTDLNNADADAFSFIKRAANAGRVKSMIHNIKQSGVYVLHGDADSTVPVHHARTMRNVLSDFHPNFCYYEYPKGEHWYGDESVDWHPIFEFFKRQAIPENNQVTEIDFTTASPVVSAKDYWIKIEQQEQPFEFSNVKANWEKHFITITTQNVAMLELDLPSLKIKGTVVLKINDQQVTTSTDKKVLIAVQKGKVQLVNQLNTKQKYAERQGGFKYAFDNNVVLVYATGGTKAEKEWYENRARVDAETFYYRGNASIDVVADTDFNLKAYKDRNVVLYGNATTNKAWNVLLKNAPIQVKNNQISVGNKTLKGNDLATYFVYPRKDSPTALVGVVAGTGEKGMKATALNSYISGITGFPDVMIFTADMLKNGLSDMKVTGFFDNDWSVQSLKFY
jgi:pimeloyl-ACP methyl ester carboxylesterase